MFAGRLTDTRLLIGAGSLTVLLAASAAMIDGPGGSGGAGSSSYSVAPTGGKAAFETLVRLGHAVERSFEPMTSVTTDPGRTMLVITGSVPPSQQDRLALRAFLEAGGHALLVGAQGAAFLDVPGALGAPPFSGEPVTYRALAPSALTAGALDITMTAESGSPKFGPSYVTLYSRTADEPLVTTSRIGKGRATWWAAATPLSNLHIASASNLQLLLNVAGPPGARRLLWDEYYHGQSRSLWSYAAATPLPWAGAQAGLILLAVFAAYSRRRGPVRARAQDTRSSPLEFIDMLRALYQRAGAGRAAVAAARSRFKRSVIAAYGLPRDSPDEAIARAVSERTRVAYGEVADVLSVTGHAVRKPDLPAGEALKLTQQLQRLTAAVAS